MDNYFDGNYYYKIRKKTFWQIVVWVVIIMFGISLLSQIKPKGDNRGERIEIDYRHLNSKLSNVDECCLCGNNARSLMGYYRKFDTIGVVSLNDWYIIDLRLKNYDSQGNESKADNGSGMWHMNDENISYDGTRTSSRGMANVSISLPEDYRLNEDFLENNLCSNCLSKVAETLEHSYFENEKSDTIPLCVIDFETLELYSMQNHYRAYSVRDYWVELDFNEENEINLSAYYLPER